MSDDPNTPAELGNLIYALRTDLEMTDDEDFLVEDNTLYFEYHRLGLSALTPVFMLHATTRHGPDPDDELSILLQQLAHHRLERGSGEAMPRRSALRSSKATHALLEGVDVQAMIDAAWPQMIDVDPRNGPIAVWRTQGAKPAGHGGRTLAREHESDVLTVPTPETQPWMAGTIASNRFEVCTFASRDGRAVVRLSEVGACARFVGLPDIIVDAALGRPLHDFVDHPGLRGLDIRIRDVMRTGKTTVTFGLTGRDLIPWIMERDPRVNDVVATLKPRLSRSRAVVARIAARRTWGCPT